MISSVWLGMAIISMKDFTFKGFKKVLVLLVTSVWFRRPRAYDMFKEAAHSLKRPISGVFTKLMPRFCMLPTYVKLLRLVSSMVRRFPTAH